MARHFYIEDNEVIPSIKFEETQPAGFTVITDQALLADLYGQKYEEYTNDGVDFYNGFRVQLAMGIGNGITPEQAFETELHLTDIKENLITGNWLTAQHICSAKPLFSLFDQALKDQILAGITNYITNKY